jgi:hypothetical protein
MAFCGKYRTLLVPREHVTNAAAIERIVQRHDGAAGVAEHEFDALSLQALQENLCSLKH